MIAASGSLPLSLRMMGISCSSMFIGISRYTPRQFSPLLGHIHELAYKSRVDNSSSGEMNQSEIITQIKQMKWSLIWVIYDRFISLEDGYQGEMSIEPPNPKQPISMN